MFQVESHDTYLILIVFIKFICATLIATSICDYLPCCALKMLFFIFKSVFISYE